MFKNYSYKILVVFMIIIIIGISFTSCVISKKTSRLKIYNSNIEFSQTNPNNGSLSGYVNDSYMNPIPGVRVRVIFHGTYEEDYTDIFGYYHVTNIPICYCMKNCTASKEGYSTEEVWLGIYENTKYDFELSCVSLQADANGPYFGFDFLVINFRGSAYCGSEPYTWHWDFGDNHTSGNQNPFHRYSDPGEYTVVLTVTDNENNTAIDTTYVIISCNPYTPEIDGPNYGKPRINYEFRFVLIHPDGDPISYYIDWNDGTITNWTQYLHDGEVYRENHSWVSDGIYKIRAKAKSLFGCESRWAEFKVKISNPRNRVWFRFINFPPILQRLLYIIV